MCKEVPLGGCVYPLLTCAPTLHKPTLVIPGKPFGRSSLQFAARGRFCRSCLLGNGNSFTSPWCWGGINLIFSQESVDSIMMLLLAREPCGGKA